MNKKGVSSIAIILIVVGILVIAGGIWAWQSQKEKPVVCTQDAKLCPDGSSVGRTGPNCEFAACPPANISQLTKEQVLNGFDPCGQQFKNGEIDNGWEKYTQLEKTCSQAQAGINLSTDSIVFADLDNDGIMEALAPARVVRASSGGALYVFENDGGTARVVDTIGFGKNNVEVVSVNKDTVIVQPYITKPLELDPNTSPTETYKFINGKLVKQ